MELQYFFIIHWEQQKKQEIIKQRNTTFTPLKSLHLAYTQVRYDTIIAFRFLSVLYYFAFYKIIYMYTRTSLCI